MTPAEYLVLCALWDLGVGTVAAIHAAVPKRPKLAYNTVLTQVRLLHAKGWVQREAAGRAHVYRARFDRDQVLRAAVRQFADNYFGGNPDDLGRFLDESGLRDTAARARRPTSVPGDAASVTPPAMDETDDGPSAKARAAGA